jgi:flagellar motor switch/type III secretory pathway protein FliN
MATVHPLPAPAGEAQAGAASSRKTPAAEAAAGQALVPVPGQVEEDEEIGFGVQVAQLPVELDVAVPVRDFRVRHLLALAPGHLIESRWGHGQDVPLAAGDVQLAWSEFEVVETQLMVRVTRLV